MNPVSQAEGPAENLQELDPARVDPFDELPLPYIEMDAHGVITRVNRASLALHNLACGQLVGKMAWELVALDEKDTSFAAYCSSLETGEAAAVVRRSLYDRSGQFRTYDMHRSLVRDANGNPAGMRMLCVDVTEAKKELDEARDRSLKLESILNAICDAVIVTDGVGFIREVNPAAEELLDRKAAELVGMTIEEGVPITAYLAGDRRELSFTMALEGRSRGIAKILDRGLREVHVRIASSPILSRPILDTEMGSTTGVVFVLHRLEVPF